MMDFRLLIQLRGSGGFSPRFPNTEIMICKKQVYEKKKVIIKKITGYVSVRGIPYPVYVFQSNT